MSLQCGRVAQVTQRDLFKILKHARTPDKLNIRHPLLIIKILLNEEPFPGIELHATVIQLHCKQVVCLLSKKITLMIQICIIKSFHAMSPAA